MLSVIKGFLIYKIDIVIFYLFSLILYPFMLYLYNVDYQPLVYGGIIYSFIFLVYMLLQFYMFYKKHRMLQDNIGRDVIKLHSQNLIEEDFGDIIQELLIKYESLENQFVNYKDDMDEYYSLWVHQIKTPIAAIQLLIQGEILNQELLKQEIFKIEQYSNMVLQYVRVSSISNDLEIKECVLEDMVKQVIKKYSSFFIHSKLSLQLENLDKVVLTDEKWLVFVIEQLISNTIKYTTEGFVTVYSHEDQAYLYLIIKDTGIGIKEEDIPRLFERGFTGFNGRVDKKSSGIGLYLVKRILDALSHSMYIESKMNEGTKVVIAFSKYRVGNE